MTMIGRDSTWSRSGITSIATSLPLPIGLERVAAPAPSSRRSGYSGRGGRDGGHRRLRDRGTIRRGTPCDRRPRRFRRCDRHRGRSCPGRHPGESGRPRARRCAAIGSRSHACACGLGQRTSSAGGGAARSPGRRPHRGPPGWHARTGGAGSVGTYRAIAGRRSSAPGTHPDERWDGRRHVTETLGLVPDDGVLPDLASVAADRSETEVVRVAAIAALGDRPRVPMPRSIWPLPEVRTGSRTRCALPNWIAPCGVSTAWVVGLLSGPRRLCRGSTRCACGAGSPRRGSRS